LAIIENQYILLYMKHLIKFSSRVDEKVLTLMKEIADNHGRKLQDVFDEALRDYIEKVQTGKVRP